MLEQMTHRSSWKICAGAGDVSEGTAACGVLKTEKGGTGKGRSSREECLCTNHSPLLELVDRRQRTLEQRTEGKFGKGKPNGAALVFGFVSYNANLS